MRQKNIDIKNMQAKVKEILLMPIICNKKAESIHRVGDVIYTGQTYYSSKDEDMSNLAVEFYNIVYRDVLNGKGLLDERGYLFNCNFAGDTMNSFNSIANLVSEAGNTKQERTSKEKWPVFLKDYSIKYHCLANFWILPMCIGRRSAKLNRYDSIDIFLNSVKKDYRILQKYTYYFEHMQNYEELCKSQFITEYPPLLTDKITNMYQNRNAEELVKRAMYCVECRAKSISSNEDVCARLYNRFKELDILS